MPYSQLPDEFCDDPRILGVGPVAAWLHTCAWNYCGRLLTDGFVPAPQVRRLADVDDVTPLVTRLVTAGLWREQDGGYYLPDFLAHNRTAVQVRAEREQNRQRQQRFRTAHLGATTMEGSNAVSNALVTPTGKRVTNAAPSHPTHDSSSPYGEEAPAAPDAPTPAVRKPRQARDTISPPTTRAVQFANQHLHMRCDEAQREAINEVVPDTPEDAHHWEDCLKEWRVRYPHNKGLAGPLDWFRDGIPPRGHPMAARGGTSPPNTPMGRLQTVMDWEEGRNGALAPAEARKALTG